MSKKDTSRIDRARQNIDRMGATDMAQNLRSMHEVVVGEKDRPVVKLPLTSLQPAPKEWNFFPSISPSKMLEMMFSIQENGLFNPIIVWEKKDGYMILSGHNRVEAYSRILTEYRETEGFVEEEYARIPAIILEEDEINENKAREIIIDTNYLQRDNDRRLMPIIVENRIKIVKNRRDKKGRTIEIVAKELGLSKTKVYEDFVIGEKIIPELSEMFFDGVITKKSLLKFANYNKGVQQFLYQNFKDTITNENCMKIKTNMDREELSKLFRNENPEKIITMQVRVPEKLKDEFRKMANDWLKEQKKR